MVAIGLLVIYLIGIGLYQSVQIIEFLPNWRDGLTPNCPPDYLGNLCSIWPDRFGSIAFGIVVSLLLSPAVLVYMATLPKKLSAGKIILIYLISLLIISIVHFSGYILYITAD